MGEPQVIERQRSWIRLDLGELWRYRELLYFLAWREVKIRYKQTTLGVTWALLQPLLTTVVFVVFFGRWAGLAEKTGPTPYVLYVLVGLLPWTFFANSITNCANSVVGASQLITKIYFPRPLIPLAALGSGLVDLVFSFLPVVVVMAYYRVGLNGQSLLAALFLLGTVLTTAGIGAVLAALIVAYRDVKFVVPFLLQILLFVTPVIYPPSIVPERWRSFLFLNPLAGLVDGFRACLLSIPLDQPATTVSLALSPVIFLAGAAYFSSVERRFADVI